MRESIKQVLACPDCLDLLSYRDDRAVCGKCESEYRIENNRTVFFINIADDIVADGIEYAKDRKAWSAFKRRNYAFLESQVRKLAKEEVIVDVGAGPGFFDHLFRGYDRYLAIDFYNYPNIDIISNIAEKRIPIRSASADCVILSNVLEHVSKPEHLLAECSRILQKGGTLLLIVPFMFKLHQEPYDFYRYTHHKLRMMFMESGFSDIVIQKMGTVTEVLNGVKYEYSRILRERCSYPFLLKQCLRLQYHMDRMIDKLFLRLTDEELTNQDIFVGYSCVATKG